MNTRKKFFGMTNEERDSFLERSAVKEFLERVRGFASEKRSVTGAELLIPEEVLEVIRAEVAKNSKLLKYFNVASVNGSTRQPVIGSIPEAVWTEMCANLNELDIEFNEVEVDGYKIGGFVPVCNSSLKDDASLAYEVINVLSASIAKGIDKAGIFGKGIRMPLGIVTRLAQTSQPETWGVNYPEWVDYHTSNIIKIDASALTGAEFFAALLGALGAAKPVFSSDGLFWVMNRKTHLDIMAKALAFNSAGALVAGANNTMPVIGGDIVEMEDDEIADGDIIGGFGGNYLMAEREGGSFGSSEHARFVADQTVFKATARYDGMPVAANAFVIVNYKNTDPETEKEFAPDYANSGKHLLTVTAAASASTSGKTVLTVTGTVAQSGAVLKYKVGADINEIDMGDKVKGFTDLTSGTTEITATTGTVIGVVELDSANRVIGVGTVVSVPKA